MGLIRIPTALQLLLCGELVATVGAWGAATSTVCGAPAQYKFKWSDGSDTYVCPSCAEGHLRRATANNRELELL